MKHFTRFTAFSAFGAKDAKAGTNHRPRIQRYFLVLLRVSKTFERFYYALAPQE